MFLDVVKLLSSENVRQIRYSDEIKQFWQVGSKLFHGILFRFMSGEKSTAIFLDGGAKQFNFAGPSRSILQSQQLYRSDDGLKSFKLCLDGKKVNISSKSLLGGVDLFGFEDKPTAQDRKDRLKKEESMIYLINNVLKKFFEKDLLDLNGCPDKYSNDCTALLGLMKDVMRLLNLRISYLRQMRVKKFITLQKLKESSGSNWRKS